MTVIAYLYSDPLLDFPLKEVTWDWEVDKIYLDLGQRHQRQQLLKDCQTSPPQYLLLRRLEELGDNLEEVSQYLSLLESWGIEVISPSQNYSSSRLKQDDPQIYLSKILQEVEDSQRRRRLQQGHANNRLKALPPPGKAPYGYRRGKDRYIIDRSTAPVVKDFFERFLLFGSLRGAVRYLEKRYGKKVAVSTARRWLVNPVYRGNLLYHNGQIVLDAHTPIISSEEAAQVDRLLKRNQPFSPRTASAPRSLAGLVVCQYCQSPMTITNVTSRHHKKDYLYLRSLGCTLNPKCKAIAYEDFLETMIAKVCIDLPQAVAQLNLPNLDDIKGKLESQIAYKQGILAQINTLQTQGILDEETANLRRYKLQIEIAELSNQLAQLPPGNLKNITQSVSAPQFWLDLSEEERRFYFREFIQQVQVLRRESNPRSWQIKLVFVF